MKEEPLYIATKGKLAMERFNEFKLFRQNLIILRAYHNLSAEKLCEQLGFTRPKRVSDYEIGRLHPSFDELRKIAKYFDLTLDQLLYQKAKVIFENKND